MMLSTRSSPCCPDGPMPDAEAPDPHDLPHRHPAYPLFYRYVRNDPANRVDPTGLCSEQNRQNTSTALPNVRLSDTVWNEAKTEVAGRYGLSGPLDQIWSQKISTGLFTSSTVGELVTGVYQAKADWYQSRDIQIADNYEGAVQLQRAIRNQQAFAANEPSAWSYTKAYAIGGVAGTGTGVKNVAVGVANTGREVAYQAADFTNTSVYLATGHEIYRGNLSNLAQAATRDDFSYATHVAETAANTITFGVYGEGKTLYQFATGQIDLNTASEQLGAAGVMQLAGAAIVRKGLQTAGQKGRGLEFSHFVPKRMGGPRNLWNGNFVPTKVHALSDPFRYRFMPAKWKTANPMPLRAVQMWVRVPFAIKGAAAAATIHSQAPKGQ